MSGRSPEATSAVIFDLNASFSRAVALTVTFGFCASNSLAILGKRLCDGSVVAMFIHSIVTLPPDSESSSPPHAASMGAAVIRTAPAESAVRKERRGRWGMPMVASWIGGGLGLEREPGRSRSKSFESLRGSVAEEHEGRRPHGQARSAGWPRLGAEELGTRGLGVCETLRYCSQSFLRGGEEACPCAPPTRRPSLGPGRLWRSSPP